jgi:shikimate kinase
LNIELIGVAGAGKTSLVRELCKNSPQFRHCRLPSRVKRLRYGVTNRLRTLAWGKWSSLTRDEYRSMNYLQAWYEMYCSSATDSANVLFDQGPVSRFAVLRGMGSELTKEVRFQDWLNEWQDKWLPHIAMIAWLDAPSEVLLERVNTRSQPHECKSMNESEAIESMDRYREAYRQTLNEIQTIGAPEVLIFDTSQLTTSQMAQQIGTKANPNLSSVLPSSKV